MGSLILIVNDNRPERKMLRVALELEGFRVIEASDGVSALDLIEASPPDLILQDMRPPDMGGLELTRRLRERARGRVVPIIALSGFRLPPEDVKDSSPPFDEFLLKPLAPSRLIEIVRKHISILDAEGSKQSPQTRKLILLVDDDPTQLKLIKLRLEGLNFRVTSAGNADEAIKLAKAVMPDLILSDVLMPSADGFDLCLRVRSEAALAGIPIILVSAHYSRHEDAELAKKAGAHALVARTPGLEEVVRQIATALHVGPDAAAPAPASEGLAQEHLSRVADQLHRQVVTNAALVEMLNLASEAIFVRDLDGSVLFWSDGAESLYGWKKEEVIGRNVHELLQTEFPVAVAAIELSLATLGRWHGNLVHTTKDGRTLTVASRHVTKSDGAETRRTILEINRDITAELQSQEALRRLERMAAVGRFAGTIAHEINNPLAAMTNIFYLLLNHRSLDAEATEMARQAEEELQRIAHITKQTLSFYRDTQQPVSVSLTEVLDSILELQAGELRRHEITLQKKYTYEGTTIGFPGELRQVFVNLIANAIQAMPNGGTLRVRLSSSRASDWSRTGLRVSICDTGSGIDPEHSKRLFEPFFTTKSMKGTGLGLWISKGIVEKHEGTIRCRSLRIADHCTTCFSVFLPMSLSGSRQAVAASGNKTMSTISKQTSSAALRKQ